MKYASTYHVIHLTSIFPHLHKCYDFFFRSSFLFFSETNFPILISYFSVFPSSFSSLQHTTFLFFFANQFKFLFYIIIFFFASASHLMCFYPFDGNVNVTIKTWHGIHLLSKKKTDIFTYNISQFTFFLPPSPSYCCSLTYNQPKEKNIYYMYVS